MAFVGYFQFQCVSIRSLKLIGRVTGRHDSKVLSKQFIYGHGTSVELTQVGHG